jgi:hypothetical protein
VLNSEELRGAGHPSPAGVVGVGVGWPVIGSTPVKPPNMSPKGGLGQGLHTRPGSSTLERNTAAHQLLS